MTAGKVYLNLEAAADIIWQLRKTHILAQLETGQYPMVISERLTDPTTPSPDADTEIDYVEAGDEIRNS